MRLALLAAEIACALSALTFLAIGTVFLVHGHTASAAPCGVFAGVHIAAIGVLRNGPRSR